MSRRGSKVGKTAEINVRKIRPAATPELREQQMVALAMDLAEKQLREGTASSQVITSIIRMGTMKERLEKEKLENENELLKAKVKSLESERETRELYARAIDAMMRYSGNGRSEIDEEL